MKDTPEPLLASAGHKEIKPQRYFGMMPLYVSNRQIVLPGEPVATRDYVVSGPVYWDGDRAYSSVVGLVELRSEREVSIVPLSGAYRPRVGDIVIGYVSDIGPTGWLIDIKSPYEAYLPLQEATLKPVDPNMVDLKDLLGVGDVVLARILEYNLTKEHPVTLTLKEARLGRIESGVIVEIGPVKVPRVIGRRGSMVNLFAELNCNVTVGQNGRVWVKCRDQGDEPFVARMIKLIERESHTSGLTDRMRNLVERYRAGKLSPSVSSAPPP